MIDKSLLDIIVCPEDHSPLSEAEEPLLAKLNGAIAEGQIENKGGHPVTEPLKAALIRQDKTLLYPVVDGIPVLLVDEGIDLKQLSSNEAER